MKKRFPDALIIGGLFVLWRVILFSIERIAPAFWPLREGFLGLLTPWANFDGAHYTSIAKAGYGGYQQAFFPFYPILIRYVTFVIKLPYEYVAVFISHAAFLIGLFLFWRYLEGWRSRAWTITFLLLYPTSFFFVAGYSESVFFALAVGALFAIKRKQWLLAGMLAGLASATRLVGVFLLFPIAFAMWRDRLRLQSFHWVALILAPAGLAAYMVYLWSAVGDPLAFFHVQAAFGAGRSGGTLIFLPQVFWRYARIFSTVSVGELLYHVAVLELLSFVLGIILLVMAWRKRYDPGLLLYSACVLLLPTLTGTLSSMPRYLLAAFPLFGVLGEIKSIGGKIVLLIVFFAILVYAATGFLQGYFVS